MFCDGQAAVSLFFVLSGFVLSLRFFREAQEPDLRNFRFMPYLWARICRLWLPYLAVFAVAALMPLARNASVATWSVSAGTVPEMSCPLSADSTRLSSS